MQDEYRKKIGCLSVGDNLKWLLKYCRISLFISEEVLGRNFLPSYIGIDSTTLNIIHIDPNRVSQYTLTHST